MKKNNLSLIKLLEYYPIDNFSNINEPRAEKRKSGSKFSGKNEMINTYDALKRYINKGYFIHFSPLEKFGINPRQSWETPLGIYAYPLTTETFKEIKTNSIKFRGDARYIILFRPSAYLNIYEIDQNGNSKQFDEQSLQNFLKKAKNYPSNVNKISDSQIYNFSQKLQNNIDKTLFTNGYVGDFFWNLKKSILDENENITINYGINFESKTIKKEILNLILKKSQIWVKYHTNLFEGGFEQIYAEFQKDLYKSLNNTQIINNLYGLLKLNHIRQRVDNEENFNKKINELFLEFGINLNNETIKTGLTTARSQTPFVKFWNVTRLLSNNLRKWRTMLVNNNVDGVVDWNSSTIHPNEPTQAVFFSTKGLNLIHIFDNPNLSSKINDDKKIIKNWDEFFEFFEKEKENSFANAQFDNFLSKKAHKLYNLNKLYDSDKFSTQTAIKFKKKIFPERIEEFLNRYSYNFQTNNALQKIKEFNKIKQKKSNKKELNLQNVVDNLENNAKFSYVINHRYNDQIILFQSDSARNMRELLEMAIKSGADLRNAYLHEAILSGAHLSGADFSGADLSGADLRGANLYEANLLGADLRGANLHEAILSGAYLHEANLSGADLLGAYLRNAYLREANLSGADLSFADLWGADLHEANLSGADLSGADLRNAYLHKANFSGAHLSSADFSGADLSDALGFKKK